MLIRSLTCFAFLSLLAVARAQTASLPYPPQDLLNRIHPEGIHAHMNYLADDLLEGRGTGTRGYMLAAKYVAAQFEEMRLKPAGDNGTYFQNVHLRDIETVPGKCSMSLTRNGSSKAQPLTWEKDWVAYGDYLQADLSVSAPLVFVGYGVTAPEFHYDDYAGVDVKGKLVVVLNGSPAKFPDAPRAYYSDTYVQSRNAADHGAIGVIVLWVGTYADRNPFDQILRFYHQPNMHWLNAQGVPNDAVPGTSANAVLQRDAAATLFEGAGKSLKQAMDDAAAGKPQAFPLPFSATLRQGARFTDVDSPNIAAILPGSDPQLKNEYVIFSDPMMSDIDSMTMSAPAPE